MRDENVDETSGESGGGGSGDGGTPWLELRDNGAAAAALRVRPRLEPAPGGGDASVSDVLVPGVEPEVSEAEVHPEGGLARKPPEPGEVVSR